MTYELAIERLMDAPVGAVWRAFADHLGECWCPRPWRAEIVAQELRPGGRSAMVMHGPDGEKMPQEGVYLEVVPDRRVVFTDAFASGWVPQGPFMVGFLELTPEGERTRYRAGARHWTAEACDQHKAMGFEAGWGAVAAQCEEVARRLAESGT
ncbi:SRPBCC family protein [Sphingomonas aracearum]|uniref:ATPase n=1 Tax=Sphingomonas aracearum TaxID=2283317 RepID=A0A369VW48_9SPHN|nr:SRPBCC family protein [Sphingomonas aracearum]RDE05865.1 ATPase [Sphingomonas aracearum]